jgi:hypothetical protein
VRLRDLQDAGVITVRSEFLSGGSGSGRGLNPGGRPIILDAAVDRTPPPPPGGFGATAGITQILFVTAKPIYRQGHGHARTKIYAAPALPLPTFADAVLYTDFPGFIGAAPFDPASNLRLWATWTSADGVESEPAGGTNGIAAATGLLEDVHIANLSVAKLLAGAISVGEYIESGDYVANTSGFRLATLGGGNAFLEINGGAFIGGLVVGATYIQSSNYVLNSQGFRWASNGTGQIGGLQVTTTGVQSSNYVAGVSGFRWDFSGAMTATGMNLYGGTLNAGTVIAGLLRNSTSSVVIDLNATGQRADAARWPIDQLRPLRRHALPGGDLRGRPRSSAAASWRAAS